MRLSEVVTRYLRDLSCRPASPNTIRSYVRYLKHVIALATVADRDTVSAFTPDVIKAVLASLREKHAAPASVALNDLHRLVTTVEQAAGLVEAAEEAAS